MSRWATVATTTGERGMPAPPPGPPGPPGPPLPVPLAPPGPPAVPLGASPRCAYQYQPPPASSSTSSPAYSRRRCLRGGVPPGGRGGREDGEGLGWPCSGLDMSAILGAARPARRGVLLASDDAAVCRNAKGAGRPRGQRPGAAGVPASAVRRAWGGADGKSCGKDNVRARTPVFRRPALLLQRITSAPGVTSGNKTARLIRHVRRPG
ncbi:hypothetical protein D9M70_477980 [compost metagenome]